MRIVELKVKPNSKKNEVRQVNNLLLVNLTKSPQQGKANKQLISLIANFFKVKTSQVIIVSGDKSRIKKIGILEN